MNACGSSSVIHSLNMVCDCQTGKFFPTQSQFMSEVYGLYSRY